MCQSTVHNKPGSPCKQIKHHPTRFLKLLIWGQNPLSRERHSQKHTFPMAPDGSTVSLCSCFSVGLSGQNICILLSHHVPFLLLPQCLNKIPKYMDKLKHCKVWGNIACNILESLYLLTLKGCSFPFIFCFQWKSRGFGAIHSPQLFGPIWV